MNWRKVAVVLAGAGFVWLLGWAIVTFSASEDTQMRKVQAKFIAALESRSWRTVDAMVCDDYDDGAMDAATVKAAMRKVLGGFFVLSITPEITRTQVVRGAGFVKTKLTVEGNGAGLSSLVVSESKRIKQPWFFHWHKRGFWPWSWELVQIHNDELVMPEEMGELK